MTVQPKLITCTNKPNVPQHTILIIYQNQDLTSNHIFVAHDLSNIVTDIQQLKNQPLDDGIYYSPNSLPVINKKNSKQGSCFRRYFVPTASIQIQADDNQIRLVPIEKTQALEEFEIFAYKEILDQIINIYHHHATVNLLFSGGIDSLIIASYVKQLNLLSRTRFLCFLDQSQTDPTALVNDQQKRSAVQQFMEVHSSELLDAQWIPLTLKDLVYGFNFLSFAHLQCHATTTAMKLFPGEAFVTGIYGNESLLHHDLHLDELRTRRPDATQEILNLQHLNPDVYARTLIEDYDLNIPFLGVDDRFFCGKPIWEIDGTFGSRVYTPLATEKLLQQSRAIDFTKIKLETITQATVARNIIKKNVGSEFDQFILHESPLDGDGISSVQVPIELLDTEKLYLPTDLKHSISGYRYLRQEIKNAFDTGSISINSLTSIKVMQHLSSL